MRIRSSFGLLIEWLEQGFLAMLEDVFQLFLDDALVFDPHDILRGVR